MCVVMLWSRMFSVCVVLERVTTLWHTTADTLRMAVSAMARCFNSFMSDSSQRLRSAHHENARDDQRSILQRFHEEEAS